MSAGRIFPVVVIAFWVASMAWLIQTKIVPLLTVAPAPAVHQVPATSSDEPIQERWTVQWNGRSIGSVETVAFRDAAHGQIDSTISLDDAPADEILEEFFGPANHLVKLAIKDFQTDSLSLKLRNSMRLDFTGRLESFQSDVFLGGIGDLLRLEGTTEDNSLTVDVTAIGDFWPETFPKQLLTRTFDLPSKAFVADAFSPPAELLDLQIGKTWHYHTYRALSPNQPLQQVEATVEAIESIGWSGVAETVFVVSLKNVNNDLTVGDSEVGKMWVRNNGTVLRQLLKFGNLEVMFLRDELPPVDDAHPLSSEAPGPHNLSVSAQPQSKQVSIDNGNGDIVGNGDSSNDDSNSR